MGMMGKPERLYSTAVKHQDDVDGYIYEPSRDLFQLDLSAPNLEIPEVFYEAEVIYSEPAWSRGFGKFMEREGKSASHDLWKQYMMNIDKICTELGLPAYIVLGAESAKYLKGSDDVYPYTITYRDGASHSGALVYLYNGAERLGATTTELVEALSERYDTILDFSVGYGNSLAYSAKRLIGTDINTKCLAYVQSVRGKR